MAKHLSKVTKLYRESLGLFKKNEESTHLEMDYDMLTASEMASFVLSIDYRIHDVVWEETLQDETDIGSFEIWSVFVTK